MYVMVDHYDSYVYNLVRDFQSLGAEVKPVRSDCIDFESLKRLDRQKDSVSGSWQSGGMCKIRGVGEEVYRQGSNSRSMFRTSDYLSCLRRPNYQRIKTYAWETDPGKAQTGGIVRRASSGFSCDQISLSDCGQSGPSGDTQSGRCLPGPGGDGGQPQIRAGLGRPVSPGSGTYRVRAGAACKLYETV